METEPRLQGGCGQIEIFDRNDDVIDTSGDRVETTACLARRGRLLRRRVRTLPGDLDAMRFRQQHPEQLLGEIGVDAGLDRLMPAAVNNVTNPRRLYDRSVRALLHGG